MEPVIQVFCDRCPRVLDSPIRQPSDCKLLVRYAKSYAKHSGWITVYSGSVKELICTSCVKKMTLELTCG